MCDLSNTNRRPLATDNGTISNPNRTFDARELPLRPPVWSENASSRARVRYESESVDVAACDYVEACF